MYKCLKINFSAATIPNNFLRTYVQKKAHQLQLEGTAQLVKADKAVKIIVYGLKESVDNFVDFLHKRPGNTILEDIEVEPFIKDRDYRGAFRIIE